MSNTPRTDKAEYIVYLGKHKRKVVRPELCRELESSLISITEQRDKLLNAAERCNIDGDDLIGLLRSLFDEFPHPALLEAADRIETVKNTIVALERSQKL